MSNYDMVVITGPTASGKTALAANLASVINGEIISADSRQVYRGMDIGTGKDYSDYIAGGKKIPVHLIDIADAGKKYNVFEYQRDFLKVFDDIRSRSIYPVVCGGSGMYIDSIVSGYRLDEVPPDPVLRNQLSSKSMAELTDILKSMKQLHNITDIDSRKRAIRAIEIETFYNNHRVSRVQFPELNALIFGVIFDRETRRNRISERLKARLENGMVDEVRKLLEAGVGSDMLIYYGLEYKYITLYISGSLTYDEMYRNLETAIHQFAKRQMTWFRGMERRGIKIHWIDGTLPMEEKVNMVKDLLFRKEH
jgi:tRNA dimethylallyltransferase